MRRALILCLLLITCQKETDERLKRVEKKLDQIRQHSAGGTSAARVVPPSDTPVSTELKDSTIKSSEADSFVHRRIAAFVSLLHDSDALVYQIAPGTTFLYRLDKSVWGYRPVVRVADVIGLDGYVHLTKAQLADLARKLGDEPRKATPVHSAIRQRWVEEIVEAGSGAFIPLGSDPQSGFVFQNPDSTILYRWDAKQALYLPIADVAPILNADHHVFITDEARSSLQDLLAHVTHTEPPARSQPPYGNLGQAVADDCVEAGVCAFVSMKGDPLFGCVLQAPQQVTILYRWDPDVAVYKSVTDVDPIVESDHHASISEAQMTHLRSLLERP